MTKLLGQDNAVDFAPAATATSSGTTLCAERQRQAHVQGPDVDDVAARASE